MKIGKNIEIKKTNFKDVDYIDIRKMYINAEGKSKPSKKGIFLSIDDWDYLVDNILEIDKEMQSGFIKKLDKNHIPIHIDDISVIKKTYEAQ